MRGGRAAADVTTKRTMHESQSYKNAETQSRPDNQFRQLRSISLSDNQEHAIGIQDFGRLCLSRLSRAKFTRLPPVEASEHCCARFGWLRSDDLCSGNWFRQLVPAIWFRRSRSDDSSQQIPY